MLLSHGNKSVYAKSDFVIKKKSGMTTLAKHNGKSKTVKIPAGVENIGESAFKGCAKLTLPVFGKNVVTEQPLK